MKCPKCQHENPDDAKFCNECATKLELVCPECGKVNPPGSKFCNECAHGLSITSAELTSKDLSFDEKLDKIQRYLPKGLTEKILAQRDKIEGERKQVTVMFCDMEGFTSLVERLGSEEAYSIMDQVYEILIHKVHNYEGTVNEMTGDGIMALFGAPIALEDASQRAIRSAYSIHRELARFSDQLKQEKEGVASIKMRIGIHTGPVVVGTLGNDLRVEFKAVGDTVNLASRIEGLAEPGATYVTGETFKLTEGLFRFEALGTKQIKGKEDPVKVYRVIAPSTRRTRFDVSAERGLTPFVGRERELELLLDGFERAKGGRGQSFSIMAEAGVGKSRLLYEFRKAVANEDVTFLEGKCLSYSRGVPYHPIIDVLKSNFDLQEEDGDSEITEKVKTGLKILGADEASTLPYLLELFSVKDSDLDKIPISAEEKKDRIIEAVKGITVRGSEIRPLIMAIEDLHWVDENSEDYLKNLLDSISGARVFLIFTYRPEFVHTWGGRSYHSQVNLNRLSNRESLLMVSHLLGTDDLDRDLEDLMLEKTEGVPFFIEEFIRSLKSLKIIERKDNKYHLAKDVQHVTIPSTIQDVLMARIDSLPEGAKEVLQRGAVIEREFSYELIKRVTGLPEQELLSHLSVLKDSELIYERGIYPQSIFVFKHALTREVIYDSILARTKKKLHEEVGNAIEEFHKENLDEHYEVLAEHLIKSENYVKGAEYSKLAGKKARKAASFRDAIGHAKKRIACIERLPRTNDMEKALIDARSVLGSYYAQLTRLFEAKEAVDPIINLVLKHNDKRRLSQVLIILGSHNYSVEEDFPNAFKHLEKALAIAEEVNDVVLVSQANFWSGFARAMNCEFEKSFSHLGKILDISLMANYPWAVASVKSQMSYFFYYLQGDIGNAYQTSADAIRLAEESRDVLSKAQAYASHGVSCYGKGLFDEGINHLLKGVTFFKKAGPIMWNAIAEFFLGKIYFEMGEYQKSRDLYFNAARLLGQSRLLPSFRNLILVGAARSKVMNNEKDINLEQIYTYVSENKIRKYEGWMRRYIAQILLNIDDEHLLEAEDWIKRAIESDERNSMMFHLGRDHALLAELFKRKGDKSKAKENLTKSIDILKECSADGWVKKYEEELASLS